MNEHSPKVFETKMEDFVPFFQILTNIKRRDESPETKQTRAYVEAKALDFMDGPLLFNVWPTLAGVYRQALVDLSLPLGQIEGLPADLDSYTIEELNLDSKHRTEAKEQCAQILRVLQPGRHATARSYDDGETRHRHDHRLGGEVASMTAAHGNEQRHNVASGQDNLTDIVKTLVGALVGQNAHTTDALKTSTGSHIVQVVPGQSTTLSTTAPSTTTPSTTTSAGTISVNAPSAGSVSSIEEQAQYVRGVQQVKMDLVTAAENQEKAAWYAKLEERFWLYDHAMAELGVHRSGGPIPTSIVYLQVPDVQACYIRLTQLWQDLGVDETWDIQKLRINKDLLYPFALGMREANFILQLLPFYGDSYESLGETGWSLSHMRWVQSDMVPYALDLPFAHSKSDVDLICQVLMRYCPEQQLLKRQFKPVDETKAAGEAQTVGYCPQYAQGICENINACNFDHPEFLRKTAVCADFITNGRCRWGLGCSFQHYMTQTQVAQPGVAQVVAPQAVNGAVQSVGTITYVLNGRGEQVNALDVNNYCQNWSRGKCNNNNCPRIHQHLPQALAQQPVQNGVQAVQPVVQPGVQQVVQPVVQAATNNQQVCREFAAGRLCRFGDKCKYSHNITQQVGDTQMGGAAVNGDNSNGAATARNPRFNKICNRESKSQPCTNNKCAFIHSNPNSRAYAATNRAAIAQAQGQNFAYVDGQPVVFAPQATGTTAQWVQSQAGQQAMAPPPVPQNNNNNNITCHQCGQVGHKKSNCPRRPNAGQQPQVAGAKTCFRCGQVGHTQNNCPGGQGPQMVYVQAPQQQQQKKGKRGNRGRGGNGGQQPAVTPVLVFPGQQGGGRRGSRQSYL